jgi:TRAP-type mannitol/chloroaromatic compound transport system permease small subunit
LLAAADTLRRNAHVRVDVFYGQLRPRQQAAINVVGTLIFLLPFCAFAIWASVPTVLASWRVLEVSPDPGGLPRYPLKTALPLAFALLGLQGISELIKGVRTLRDPPPQESA